MNLSDGTECSNRSKKKRLSDVFPHPKREASLLSAHQKALQHEIVVLETVLHEMSELLVLRVVGVLRDPHDQPSYGGHVCLIGRYLTCV